MTFVVRRIRPDEGARLREIRLRSLRDAPDAFAIAYEEEAARPEEWWDGLAKRGALGSSQVVFVVEADGEFVALAGGFIGVGSRTAHLVAMWTAGEARRRGIGRALIAAVTGWADEVEVAELDLWVTVGNEPARLLYESAGFHITDEFEPLPSNPSTLAVRMCRPPRPG